MGLQTASNAHAQPLESGLPEDPLEGLRTLAKDLQTGSRAENTRRSYGSGFASFRTWCNSHRLSCLPASPETVILYIAHLAQTERKVSTVERALVAISQSHLDANLPSPRNAPLVARTMRGLRRRTGSPTPKDALTHDELVAMVTALPTDLAGIRDRALLTLGFESGLRRSELVALDFEHLKWIGSDVVVTVARSKTDQEARGRRVCVRRNDGAACAVRALDAWMSVADVKTSALFRQIRKGGHLTNLRLGDRAIERTVKYAADLAGMDSSRLSGHSLRSGFATAQARMGVPERTLMLRLGHSTPEMTRRYVRITEED